MNTLKMGIPIASVTATDVNSGIILDDITVSRNHALLSVSKDNINIVDNNSTNGIYINNEITNSCKIKSGDKIQIGKYLLLLTEVTK